MKTFVLTISQRFPQTHKRKGENTYFPGKILDEIKIHTIRANYDLWAKRIEMINKGEAVLSVRYWYEKPYRSPQIEFAEFTSIGLEKLKSIDFENGFAYYVDIVKRNVLPVHVADIARNDGLYTDDFENWFKGYDLTKPMAIIHFTNFRYSNT